MYNDLDTYRNIVEKTLHKEMEKNRVVDKKNNKTKENLKIYKLLLPTKQIIKTLEKSRNKNLRKRNLKFSHRPYTHNA